MMKEIKVVEKNLGQDLDLDAYQKLTTYLLLHRKMESASSKIRKDVKGAIKRKIIHTSTHTLSSL